MSNIFRLDLAHSNFSFTFVWNVPADQTVLIKDQTAYLMQTGLDSDCILVWSGFTLTAQTTTI